MVSYRDLFSITHIFYKAIGVSPFYGHIKQSLRIRIFFWLSFLNAAVSLALEFIFLCKALGKFEGFLQVTALVPCMCFVVLALNEMMVVSSRRERIIRVLAELEELFPKTVQAQRDQHIQETTKRFNWFLFGFSGSFVALILTFNFIPFTMTLIDYVAHGRWAKELPYFLWYPFDAYDNRWFAFCYFHQTWAGFTTVFGILAQVFLIGSSVLQFCFQFERISNALLKYRPGRALRSKDHQFLHQTVVQHIKILELAHEFADIISETILTNYICSSLVICFVGFQVIAGENLIIALKFLLFLFCSLMQTTVMSFFGHQMIEYVRIEGGWWSSR